MADALRDLYAQLAAIDARYLITPELLPVGTRVRLRDSSPWCSAWRDPIPPGTEGAIAGWWGEPEGDSDHEARHV
jgi:hypothetical protein